MRNPYTRELRTIFVAGGCFWGVQEYYKRLKGIENTAVGYANSNQENISYQEVCSGKTGAVEAVMIQYNHAVISLDVVDHCRWSSPAPVSFSLDLVPCLFPGILPTPPLWGQ